jgi:hypothetical protein
MQGIPWTAPTLFIGGLGELLKFRGRLVNHHANEFCRRQARDKARYPFELLICSCW